MGEMGGWAKTKKTLKNKNKRRDMGKVGCDIWEKWVRWVEK